MWRAGGFVSFNCLNVWCVSIPFWPIPQFECALMYKNHHEIYATLPNNVSIPKQKCFPKSLLFVYMFSTLLFVCFFFFFFSDKQNLFKWIDCVCVCVLRPVVIHWMSWDVFLQMLMLVQNYYFFDSFIAFLCTASVCLYCVPRVSARTACSCRRMPC